MRSRFPTEAELRELAGRPWSAGSRVLSLYLDLRTARGRPLEGEFRRLLREASRGLPRGERRALAREALSAWRFLTGCEPHGNGLVLFSSSAQGLLWSGELDAPVRGGLHWARTPHLLPLWEAADEYERATIVLVDRRRARFFRQFLGNLEEDAGELSGDRGRRPRRPGKDRLRSHGAPQREADERFRRHLGGVAARLEGMAREGSLGRLLLGGPAPASRELFRALAPGLRARVAGVGALPVEAPAAEVRRFALQLAERAERSQERRLVDRVLERPPGAALGLDASLAALRRGRASTLVYMRGFAARGARCPGCSALWPPSARGKRCARCGERLAREADLLEAALETAARSGVLVEEVRGEAARALAAAGGIAALPGRR